LTPGIKPVKMHVVGPYVTELEAEVLRREHEHYAEIEFVGPFATPNWSADSAAAQRMSWLQEMREKLAADVDAMVCIGGRGVRPDVPRPGVQVEASLAVLASKPLYLAAALGGFAQHLDYQHVLPEPEKRRNGLLSEDNAALAQQADPSRITELILKGLENVWNAKATATTVSTMTEAAPSPPSPNRHAASSSNAVQIPSAIDTNAFTALCQRLAGLPLLGKAPPAPPWGNQPTRKKIKAAIESGQSALPPVYQSGYVTPLLDQLDTVMQRTGNDMEPFAAPVYEHADSSSAVRLEGAIRVHDFEVNVAQSLPLAPMQESARQVGAFISTAKLQALSNDGTPHSVQEIETWDDMDENISRQISQKLSDDQTVVNLGDDAQLIAGATLTLIAEPDKYDQVTSLLDAALDDSFNTDPIWGIPAPHPMFTLVRPSEMGKEQKGHEHSEERRKKRAKSRK
jgi:hypothetical protein